MGLNENGMKMPKEISHGGFYLRGLFNRKIRTSKKRVREVV